MLRAWRRARAVSAVRRSRTARGRGSGVGISRTRDTAMMRKRPAKPLAISVSARNLRRSSRVEWPMIETCAPVASHIAQIPGGPACGTLKVGASDPGG
jgi:hypothetical protein